MEENGAPIETRNSLERVKITLCDCWRVLEFVDKCLRDKRSVGRNLGNLHKFPLEYLAKYVHGVKHHTWKKTAVEGLWDGKKITNKQELHNDGEHWWSYSQQRNRSKLTRHSIYFPGKPKFCSKFILTSP